MIELLVNCFTLNVIFSEIEINSPATCLKSCAEYSPGFTIYPDSSLLKFLDEMIDVDSDERSQFILLNPFLLSAFTFLMILLFE